ncbi:hypothetical protein [Archangium sp.]|uniref:hypothetical protein n=1 Tax=Archangium sp. TaxID=1872627 RepID=UPI002D3F941E|nr:hypothetical protein [Archangium sp.]HYO52254.1 hypothetical protein [Archangium sp.]
MHGGVGHEASCTPSNVGSSDSADCLFWALAQSVCSTSRGLILRACNVGSAQAAQVKPGGQ